MKHQLILIDGQSTVGKSSISKSVYEQILHSDQAYWLHEECEKHPIRFEEFEAGTIHSLERMELNRQAMLKKWVEFAEDIRRSNKICVTEGCFLHSVDRFLLESEWDDDEIIRYFNQIMEIITPLNPLIIFLHKSDIKSSFQRAFKARGDWWEKLILGVPEPYGYFKNHQYTGDDSIYDSFAYAQQQMAKIFDVLACDKLKIDTSQEDWDSYTCKITEKAGYEYHKTEKKLPETDIYSGAYRIQDGNDIWNISFDDKTQSMYTSLFWPYMPMRYTGNMCLELISFPVILRFDDSAENLQFIVEGNYDWDYNGKTFIKI